MKKTLVVCGDSYNYGIGCVDLATTPYAVKTAQHFNWELVRLARGSASNYIIYLQGMYAADMAIQPHLIVLGETSYDRTEWISSSAKTIVNNYSALNINYHQYPPHNVSGSPEFYFKDDPQYCPVLLSEQISGIDHCLSIRKTNQHAYDRLAAESDNKLQLIRDHYLEVTEYAIKAKYDVGLILQAYTYIKRKGIPVIILTRNIDAYKDLVDAPDLMFQDWYELSNVYPDTIGSLHTSEVGHADTANRLIKKIIELKYD
jgi:hypothetical protein